MDKIQEPQKGVLKEVEIMRAIAAIQGALAEHKVDPLHGYCAMFSLLKAFKQQTGIDFDIKSTQLPRSNLVKV